MLLWNIICKLHFQPKLVNTEQKLVIRDKIRQFRKDEFCDIKATMCNILSNQKPAFACKGLCANCQRKSALSDERPEQRIEAAISSSIIRQSNTSDFVRKDVMLSTGK
jgi:hypothetical protein